MIYSLIATARKCGHDPFAYFKDILTRLPASTTNQVQSLLPQNWKSAEV